QAKDILQEHREALTRLAETLLEYETLDLDDVEAIIKGEKISRDIKPESPDAPAPEEKDKDKEKQSLPSLVNPKERPAPA
ncbi:MAG: cell division protein FtsH, partial [Acidobacteriota bacterium]